MLTDKEKDLLYLLILDNKEAAYRAKIILLKSNGYTVSEIRMATNLIYPNRSVIRI